MRRYIDLLVFMAEGNTYGVHASQVEELLVEGTSLFWEANDVRSSYSYKGQQLRIVRLAEYMRQTPECCDEIAVPSLEISLPGRILVTANRRDDGYFGLLIQELQQLVSLPVEYIFPLPMLMKMKRRTRLIWGIALLQDVPVILLDLEQL